VAAAQTTPNLGIFEGASDVGGPSHKGTVVYDPALKQYRVTGGGQNMWAARDDFFFVWRKMSGDVVLTANVRILSDGNAHRKAALRAFLCRHRRLRPRRQSRNHRSLLRCHRGGSEAPVRFQEGLT